MHQIYLITNKLNGKVYVGKTSKTASERYKEHLADTRRGCHFRVHQALRKHTEEAFDLTLIEEVQDDDASAAEVKWIAHHKSKNWKFGYNMTDGGEGRPGWEVPRTTRMKIGAASKARVALMSKEERKMMTASANEAKCGKKEKPSSIKKASLQETWDKMSDEKRAQRGAASKAGVSEEGKLRQIEGWNSAFSPVRQKGYKQPIVQCPHCEKSGGRSIMGRYHFNNCKSQ